MNDQAAIADIKGAYNLSVDASNYASPVTSPLAAPANHAATAVFNSAAADDQVVLVGSFQTVVAGSTVTVMTGMAAAQFTDGVWLFNLTSPPDLLVYELYQAAYGRTPDRTGFTYWAGVADSNPLTPLKLADFFLAAPEFTAKYGANPSNTTYITELYTNVLGRAPDAAGLAYWIGQANAGQPHDALLVAFATSQENANLIGAHTQWGFWTTL
jgi:hypothetical protein